MPVSQQYEDEVSQELVVFPRTEQNGISRAERVCQSSYVLQVVVVVVKRREVRLVSMGASLAVVAATRLAATRDASAAEHCCAALRCVVI